MEEENVTELFSQCGTIQQVRFATDRETGDFKGFGALPTPPSALRSRFARSIWANTSPLLSILCTVDLGNCGAVLHT